MTDGTYHSYAAATLLNRAMRKAWFSEKWKGKELSSYVGAMQNKVYDFWKDNYRKDAGTAVEKKEVKNLIARNHYLQPIVEADNLFAYPNGERIRPNDGDATFTASRFAISLALELRDVMISRTQRTSGMKKLRSM
jgi:hypothetical protein